MKIKNNKIAWKISSLFIGLLLVLFSSCDQTTSGSEEVNPPVKQEVNIQIKSRPSILKYDLAENSVFSSEGLVVQIVYSDGTLAECIDYKLFFNNTIEITDGFDLSGTVAGDYTVLIKYKNFTANFQLTIEDSSKSAAQFSWAEIIAWPNKNTYKVGETFSKEGISIKRHYTDDSTDITDECTIRLSSGKEIYDGYVFGDYDLNPDTDYAVDFYVYYQSNMLGYATLIIYPQTGEIDPNVFIYDVICMGKLEKTDYKVGETFSTEGIQVKVIYSDESYTYYTANITLSNGFVFFNNGHVFTEEEVGDEENDYQVTCSVTFLDEDGVTWMFDDSFTLNIRPSESNIQVIYLLSKQDYGIGEYFNTDGDIVELYDNGVFLEYISISDLTYEFESINGTYKHTIENGYKFTKEDFESQEEGISVVNVYYEGKVITNFNIFLNEKPSIKNAEVISTPEKTLFYVGEAFTYKGMVVKVTYVDDTTEEIDAFIFKADGKEINEGYIFTVDDVLMHPSFMVYTKEGKTLYIEEELSLSIEVKDPDPDVYGIYGFGILEYPSLTIVEQGKAFNPLLLSIYYKDINGREVETQDYVLRIKNSVTEEYEELPEKFTKTGAYEIYVLYSKNTVEKFFSTCFNITVVDVEVCSDFDYEDSEKTSGLIIKGFKTDSEEPEIEVPTDPKDYVPVYSTPSDFIYEFINDTDIKITKVKDEKIKQITELTIPAKIDGYNVKTVSLAMFFSSVARNLTIEEGVEEIDLEGISPQAFNFGSIIPYAIKIVLPKGFKPFRGMMAGFTYLEEVYMPEDLEVIAHHMFERSAVKKVYGTKNVQIIDEYAFKECSKLEEVEFGDALVKIGVGAFKDCISFKNIPDISNIVVLSEAFSNTGVEELVITSLGLTELFPGSSAIFSYCEKLKKITIEGDVYFRSGDFMSCDNLETIVCNGTILGEFESSFRYCNSLKDVTIRIADDDIDKSNLQISPIIGDCENLKTLKVILANRNNYLLFSNNPNLETVTFEYDSSVSGTPAFDYFVPEMFMNCPKLQKINIPNVPAYEYKIGRSAFEGCSLLNASSILFPANDNTGISIGETAFKNCTNLSSFNLDSFSRVSIEERAFEGTKITQLELPANSEVYFYSKALFGISLKNIIFGDGVSCGSESNFIENPWQCTTLDFSNTKRINCDFSNFTSLKTVIVGDSINFCSFKNCTKLSTVTVGEDGTFLPSSMENTAITKVKFQGNGNDNFFGNRSDIEEVLKNCPNLKEVTFGGCMISSYFFGKNPNYKDITINFEGSTGFFPYAFYDCDFITSLVMPSCGVIYSYAFAECDNLKTVTLNDNRSYPFIDESIGAFYNCKNLQSVVTKKPIKEFTDYVFYNCRNLEYVTFPDYEQTGIKIEIGDTAFNNCLKILPCFEAAGQLDEKMFLGLRGTGYTIESLTWDSFSENFYGIGAKNVELTSRIYYIPTRWAEGNTYIESIKLDAEIESKAFINCTNLKSVTIGDTCFHSVKSDSFENCPLEVIYVPEKYYDMYMSSYKWEKYKSLIKAY